jgi:hypothetical protein
VSQLEQPGGRDTIWERVGDLVRRVARLEAVPAGSASGGGFVKYNDPNDELASRYLDSPTNAPGPSGYGTRITDNSGGGVKIDAGLPLAKNLITVGDTADPTYKGVRISADDSGESIGIIGDSTIDVFTDADLNLTGNSQVTLTGNKVQVRIGTTGGAVFNVWDSASNQYFAIDPVAQRVDLVSGGMAELVMLINAMFFSVGEDSTFQILVAGKTYTILDASNNPLVQYTG